MRRRFINLVAIAVYLAFGSVVASTQPTPPPTLTTPLPVLVQPVTGNFVYLPVIYSVGDLPVVISLDTATGIPEVLLRTTDLPDVTFGSPLFDTSGDHVAYQVGTNLISMQSIADKSLTYVPNNGRIHSYPVGWLNNDQQVLLLSFVSGLNTPEQNELQIADVNTGQYSTVLQLTEGVAISTIFPQLSQGVDSGNIVTTHDAIHNPVYQEWVVLLMDNVMPGENYSSIALLYNFVTHEAINLNTIINDVPSTVSQWSADGSFIAINGRSNHYILSFEPSITTIPAIHKTAPTSRFTTGAQIVDFLGVQDLLLLSRVTDTQLIYDIGQVQDGNFLSREFITFERTESLKGLAHTWHLSAAEAERHALSCMFDTALPARLSIGASAVTNGPLSLLKTPDAGALEITLLAQGTQVDIISGPACVNSDRYSRLWQIQLADGTVGWAAEASSNEYFLHRS
jgi:hypothetical protein